MRRCLHPLLSPSLGCERHLVSLQFGPEGAERKMYIQASLHADELPGMLVAHHLRLLLEEAQAQGRLQARVVLVPAANPLGLAQRAFHRPQGRFEWDSLENFNRAYPNLAEAVYPLVRHRLGSDPEANVRLIRQTTEQWLRDWSVCSEIDSLRRQLLLLSHDADWVLDLHCDHEAVMHLYTQEPCWPKFEALARRLGCQTVLLAQDSGGGPFDERLSGLWEDVRQKLATEQRACPIPQACASTTVELRGETQVQHTLAQQDARAILSYLVDVGGCTPAPQGEVENAALLCRPTPLAGSQTLRSNWPGVLVYLRELGEHIHAQEVVAHVIDPTGESSAIREIRAEVSGVFYARVSARYVHAGGEVGKIAGATPFRTGHLLGA